MRPPMCVCCGLAFLFPPDRTLDRAHWAVGELGSPISCRWQRGAWRFKRQKRRLIDGENDSVLTVALLWPGLIAGFTAKHWRFDVALFLLILPVILGALAVDRILSLFSTLRKQAFP